MKTAYNPVWLHNLNVLKEIKQWRRDCFFSQGQFAAICEGYRSGFYHPNLMIRLLLFISSLIALSGITGLLILLFGDVGENALSILSIIYGVASCIFLENVFIRSSHHYKSGVNEALLYHSIGFVIAGVGGLTDFNTTSITVTCIVVFGFSALRYLDLISTTAALCALAYLVFFEMYEFGGVAQQIIPFAFIILFTPLYFYFRNLKQRKDSDLWTNCIIVAESFSLLIIYAAGNYFVVRELSVNLMDLELGQGEDIPLAFVFYFLTVTIPLAYLYFGIKHRDIVLLRVSLVAIAFSVFTFKYYYSTGHHEITFTVSGALLLLIALALFRYLKTPKQGYTRENILKEKWASMNPEAFIMSQTLGGNEVTVDDSFKGGGGGFGGGGASGDY